MNLAKIYPDIKKAVAALIPAYSSIDGRSGRPAPPPILGTGFFINPDGVLVTNNHVVDTFKRFTDNHEKGVRGIIFHHSNNRVKEIVFNIKKIVRLDHKSTTGKAPDLAFIKTDLSDNHFLQLMDDDTEIVEGMEIATSGFPTGRYSLMGPDGYVQISPTLQRGIISAILPYPKKYPDAFSVNIMTHGGASGSPVFFTDTGKVTGMLFSILTDLSFSTEENIQITPTSITYALPAHLIKKSLKEIDL